MQNKDILRVILGEEFVEIRIEDTIEYDYDCEINVLYT